MEVRLRLRRAKWQQQWRAVVRQRVAVEWLETPLPAGVP